MREGEGALEGGEDEVAFDGLWLVLSLGLSPFHRDSVRLRPLLLLPFWGDVLLALGERGLGEVLVEINVSVCSVASSFFRGEAAE